MRPRAGAGGVPSPAACWRHPHRRGDDVAAELDDADPEALDDIRFWLCVSCAQKLNPDLDVGKLTRAATGPAAG